MATVTSPPQSRVPERPRVEPISPPEPAEPETGRSGVYWGDWFFLHLLAVCMLVMWGIGLCNLLLRICHGAG